MAKHLAPSQKKKMKMPDLRREALPKVVSFRFGESRREYERQFSLRFLIPVLAAALLFLVGFLLRGPSWVKVLLLGASALCSGFDLLRRSLARIVNRKMPDEELLFFLAAVIAFAVGEFAAGAFALLVIRAAELVQAYALARGENGVELLRGIMPEKARVVHGDENVDTLPENVEIGDTILVKPDERIPVDGEVLSGLSTLDCSALTGLSDIVNVSLGSKVRSGCLNLASPLYIRAEKRFEDSTAAKRLESFEQACAMESKLEKRLSRYAAMFTPALILCAVILGVIVPIFSGDWTGGLHRAVVFLLLCSPCALLISVPLCFKGAIVCAERKGVRIFGKSCIERLAQVRTMAFGKTGVITDGRFRVTDVFPDGVSEQDLLRMAAAAETRARNPVSEALRDAGGWTRELGEGVMQIEEIPGRGVSAFIEGRHVYVGNAALMEEHGIYYLTPNRAGSAIHVAVENQYWGHILLSDKIREGAFDAVEDLRAQGVNQMVLLTGDVLSVSKSIASALNFDMVRSELSPDSKLSAIRYLMQGLGERATLAYVGDGINDAALFDLAHVGISIDTLRHDDGNDKADVAVMSGEIRRLPVLLRIAKTAWTAVWQNIILCCLAKALLLILALFGAAPISICVAADALCTALTALNSLRSFVVE